MKRPGYVQCIGEYWQKQRMRALVRDDFTCRYPEGCTEDGGQPETRLRFLVIHHIKPRIQGGKHDLDNLLTVCKTCHTKYHPHLRYELAMTPRVLEMEGRVL